MTRVETLDALDDTLTGAFWFDLRTRQPLAATLKRVLDVTVAVTLLVPLAPALLFLRRRAERRIGFRGNEFVMFQGAAALVNVLEGTMSLVGPRAIRPEEKESGHRRRFSVRPGLTGLWRVTPGGDERELDRRYINEWTLGLDLEILRKTFL